MRIVGEHHAKYRLAVASGLSLEAIHFGGVEAMREAGQPLRATYQLTVNRYRDLQTAELRIQSLLEA